MFLWFGAFTKTLVGITELEFDATIFSFWVQEDFAFNAFCSKFYFQEREREVDLELHTAEMSETGEQKGKWNKQNPSYF